MSVERDGRRVSAVLTEARTVLSRAETAHTQVSRYARHADPAAEDVLAALAVAIAALEPFARTSKSGCRHCGAEGPEHLRDPKQRWRLDYTCEVPSG